MKKKKGLALISTLLIAGMALSGCGGAKDVATDDNKDAGISAELTFASGGTSGTYYPYASAVGQIWMNTIDGVNVSVQATGGSAENLNLIAQDDAQVAIVQNDTMTYAAEGTGNFAEVGANKEFSTLGTVYAEVVQLIARADSGITSVADLKGKSVSVGDIGSGVEANALQVLAAYGLTFDDLKAQHLGFGSSTDAMKDGQVQAAFITAGTPTTAVTEFATTNDVVIIPIDGAEAQSLLNDYGYYTSYTIPADTYKGVDSDIETIAVKATLIVRNDLSEDTVYALTKSLFENKDELINAMPAKGEELDINTAVEGVSVDFHPGALKYYKEMGIIK